MLRLDSVTSVLQAVLAGAVSSVQPQATVCFSDDVATAATYTGGKQVTVLNSTTDVTICAAPAAATVRDIDTVTIHNRDTATVTVSVKYDISGTDSTIVRATLLTLETLQYNHGDGWKVITADGSIKTSSSGGSSSPTGPAGGDLTGTYPNPTIANGAIALDELSDVVITAPATGATLIFDGVNWIDGALNLADTDAVTGTLSTANGGTSVTSLAALATALALMQSSGGRVTLSSGVPVMTSDVSNATTVYYTPYLGNRIALYDGTNWQSFVFAELSQTTTDTTKSPAAVAANSNYDMFVWNDAGTLRCTRGPAWTSDTARGAGAGTTEIVLQDGVLVNAVAITNGAVALRGRYVGSIRSDAGSAIDWEMGGSAAGGDPGFLYVWNMNRVDVAVQNRDSAASWTTTSTTFVSLNASNSNRISFLRGLNEDGVSAQFRVFSTNSTAGQSASGIALDNTTTLVGSGGFGVSGASTNNVQVGTYSGNPGLGVHFLQAIQVVQSGTGTWYGNFFAGGEDREALTAQFRM